MNPPEKQQDSFKLPSRLRIMQRLGQVSRNAAVKQNLFPRIADHAKESFTPKGFVDMLEGEMKDFSAEHQMGIGALLLDRMPTYIGTILTDEHTKAAALGHWHARLEELKAGDQTQ